MFFAKLEKKYTDKITSRNTNFIPLATMITLCCTCGPLGILAIALLINGIVRIFKKKNSNTQQTNNNTNKTNPQITNNNEINNEQNVINEKQNVQPENTQKTFINLKNIQNNQINNGAYGRT